ncbi:uncharacterized protein [Miscanthus floridulus]|uniref:uncharacterized protein n=1 Tax=Miscanthus floridulus TaxID=154761 RepID=UPI003457BC6F
MNETVSGRGESKRTAAEIAALSGRQATEFKQLQALTTEAPGHSRQSPRWERPPSGMLKLNVDGAFREADKDGGWGYVIRDESGDVIQSGAGKVSLAINPMHAELIACMEGVKAAAAIGMNNIVPETDAQQVAWAIQGDDFRLAVVGGLVHELKVLLSVSFASVLVRYAPRECNKVAHELASIGCKSQGLAPLVRAGVLDCIMFLVSGDLADMVE